jgi:hypothetical protein
MVVAWIVKRKSRGNPIFQIRMVKIKKFVELVPQIDAEIVGPTLTNSDRIRTAEPAHSSKRT